MASRLTNICIDAADPLPLAHFWCAVLGWDITEASDSGVRIAPDGSTAPVIDVLPVGDAKRDKNRLHLDLRADDLGTDEELDRLLGLGATRVDVGQSPDAPWVVLADPEGNEFCLLFPSVHDDAR